ncbi:MAG: hypothetical protein QME90_07840 [Thermodesulfobacteriota bacterium]|nr:hypothetical protein [Thermodesulfobacteriota bacterium]
MLGERLGYMVYAAQCKFGRNGEWMFDLTWAHEKGDISLSLPLVMESEWDSKDILWDFSKLVMARADLRVMVFWEKTKQRAATTLRGMLNQIRKFRGTMVGDRYLFCYWTDKPDRLYSESYVVRKRSNLNRYAHR